MSLRIQQSTTFYHSKKKKWKRIREELLFNELRMFNELNSTFNEWNNKNQNLQYAVTFFVTIDIYAQNNNIRSLRDQSSSNQRLCWALIMRVAERCAISTDWIDLCHKALINFSSSAKITVSDVWQCMTEILSYCTLTTMSLLHVSQQWGIVVTSHRAEILCIKDVTQR